MENVKMDHVMFGPVVHPLLCNESQVGRSIIFLSKMLCVGENNYRQIFHYFPDCKTENFPIVCVCGGRGLFRRKAVAVTLQFFTFRIFSRFFTTFSSLIIEIECLSTRNDYGSGGGVCCFGKYVWQKSDIKSITKHKKHKFFDQIIKKKKSLIHELNEIFHTNLTISTT